MVNGTVQQQLQQLHTFLKRDWSTFLVGWEVFFSFLTGANASEIDAAESQVGAFPI